MTAGTERVAELVRRHGARVVARALGVDHKTIAKLVAGSTPRPPLRAKLLEVYGLTWDEGTMRPEPAVASSVVEKVDIGAPGPAKAHPRGASDAGPLDTRVELGTMIRQLRTELERLNADPKATARERANVAAAVTAAMRVLVKVDGSTSITMSGILRSDHWVKLRNAVFDALAAHPEALADVNAALRKLVD